MKNTFDALSHFARWFMAQPIDMLHPVCVFDYGPLTSLVLYREAPFQVEMFVVKPGAGFPEEHRHPKVDSYEVNLSGNIPLTVNGQLAVPVWCPRSGDPGNLLSPVPYTRVRETDLHGSTTIKEGGAFLSIQHWLDGEKPSSVGLNWEGTPPSPEHEKLLEAFESLAKNGVEKEEPNV